MRINFYDTRIASNGTTILVKERGLNYEASNAKHPENIVLMMQVLLHVGELAEEHCYMIALNSSCRILGIFFLSKGTVCASLVSPREIFMRALLIGAVQIIFCHNHPSGNAVPTDTDIKLTKRIQEAGTLLNVSLADHIVIGGNSYLSFKEANLL